MISANNHVALALEVAASLLLLWPPNVGIEVGQRETPSGVVVLELVARCQIDHNVLGSRRRVSQGELSIVSMGARELLRITWLAIFDEISNYEVPKKPKRERTHAIDCDMDEDCVCGAGWS